MTKYCCKTCHYGLLIVLAIQLQHQSLAAAATANNPTVLTSLYQPTTNVDDFAAKVDQNQGSIQGQLALGTEEGMQQALEIYQNGEGGIQGFSTNAQAAMLECTTKQQFCPIPTYKSFADYYGAGDYADKWITAAFESQPTPQFDSNGNVDFSIVDSSYEGRGEFIKISTLVMNIWMRVIQAMYQAVEDCDLHSWDQAVALYVGSASTSASTAKPTNKGIHGNMLYALAQEHCSMFRTCNKDGQAKVNAIILQEFQRGQARLKSANGQCDTDTTTTANVKSHVDRIVAMMTVPLLQGFLTSTNDLDWKGDTRDSTKAQVLAYGTSLLPLLHACDANFAKLVQSNLPYVATSGTSFEVVKDAVQRSYDCLGISCQDVGGFVDLVHTGQYLAGAEPCGYEYSKPEGYEYSKSEGRGSGFVVGVTLAILVISISFGTFFIRQRRKTAAHNDEAIEKDIQDLDLPEIA